jgi:hypothetical protein
MPVDSGGPSSVTLLGSFELLFRPSVALVSVVRRFVGDFYQEILGVDGGGQLALTTHELLENAVKYGTTGETLLCIDVHRDANGRVVRIRTRNQTNGEHIREVRELVDRLQGQSAFDLYQKLMRESLSSPGRSGLGLARIAAEADMELSFEVVGSELTILAGCRISEAS